VNKLEIGPITIVVKYSNNTTKLSGFNTLDIENKLDAWLKAIGVKYRSKILKDFKLHRVGETSLIQTSVQ